MDLTIFIILISICYLSKKGFTKITNREKRALN